MECLVGGKRTVTLSILFEERVHPIRQTFELATSQYYDHHRKSLMSCQRANLELVDYTGLCPDVVER